LLETIVRRKKLMKKENNPDQKHFKNNSYEIEKENNETIHLSEAPAPHVSGRVITEDME
jgi:hypothetical protein